MQVAVISSLNAPVVDVWITFAILSTMVGYCAKIYITYVPLSLSLPLHLFWYLITTYGEIFSSTTIRYQNSLTACWNLITQSMYDKQLDSGKSTLLHLCDNVIQQEVSSNHVIVFPITSKVLIHY